MDDLRHRTLSALADALDGLRDSPLRRMYLVTAKDLTQYSHFLSLSIHYPLPYKRQDRIFTLDILPLISASSSRCSQIRSVSVVTEVASSIENGSFTFLLDPISETMLCSTSTTKTGAISWIDSNQAPLCLGRDCALLTSLRSQMALLQPYASSSKGTGW